MSIINKNQNDRIKVKVANSEQTQKMKAVHIIAIMIDNFTEHEILILGGEDKNPEPDYAEVIKKRETKRIDIDTSWDRITLNNVKSSQNNPYELTQEEFDKVVNYVRDAVWTKRG